jgi:hypothetical protein
MITAWFSRVTVAVLVTTLCGGAAVAGGALVTDLRIGKGPGGTVVLDWSACHPGPSVTTYSVYAGVLGDFTSHARVSCDAGQYTQMQLVPAAGYAYFLVVQTSGGQEGSYGSTSSGERPQAVVPCATQSIGSCVVEDLGRCFYQTSPPIGWRIVPSPGVGSVVDGCTGGIYQDTDPGNGDGQIDNCDCNPP